MSELPEIYFGSATPSPTDVALDFASTINCRRFANQVDMFLTTYASDPLQGFAAIKALRNRELKLAKEVDDGKSAA